jgi:hypothetical protein
MDCCGRAGLALIAGAHEEAIAHYSAVLAMEAEGAAATLPEPPVRLDLQQRLHVRMGLAAALAAAGAPARPALEAEASALRDEYLAPHSAAAAATEAERVRTAAAAAPPRAPPGWFVALTAAAARSGDGGAALLRRVAEATMGRCRVGRVEAQLRRARRRQRRRSRRRRRRRPVDIVRHLTSPSRLCLCCLCRLCRLCLCRRRRRRC